MPIPRDPRVRSLPYGYSPDRALPPSNFRMWGPALQRAPEVIGPNNPYFKSTQPLPPKTLADLRKKNVIGLDDLNALSVPPPPPSTPPTYSPVIDQQALGYFDTHQVVPQEASPYNFLGPDIGGQVLKSSFRGAKDTLGNIFSPSKAWEPRGIRNNNPGNMEYHDAGQYGGQGFAKAHGATGYGDAGRFAAFPSPELGVASIFAKQREMELAGKTTVAKRIEAWSPASENGTANTKAYINAVSSAMGIDPNTSFSIKDPVLGNAFVTAMIHHENGSQPYTPEQINMGRLLTDQISPTDQARELQAQQARVGLPSLTPPSPFGGANTVAGVFNSPSSRANPVQQGMPDFDKMSNEEQKSFIEDKKTQILGIVANHPQLASDPSFADQLDKASIVPKSVPQQQTAQPQMTGTNYHMGKVKDDRGMMGPAPTQLTSMIATRPEAQPTGFPAARGPSLGPSMVRPQGMPTGFPPAPLSGQATVSPPSPMPSAQAGPMSMNMPPLQGQASAGPPMPSPFASANANPLSMNPLSMSGQASTPPPSPPPSSDAGYLLTPEERINGAMTAATAPQPTAPSMSDIASPQIRQPMNLTGSALGPQMPQMPSANATANLPALQSPFDLQASMSATPDQRMAMPFGSQQKPLATPPVALAGQASGGSLGVPPPSASSVAGGPLPLNPQQVSLTGSALGPQMPSASAGAGRLPITPPPMAVSGNVTPSPITLASFPGKAKDDLLTNQPPRTPAPMMTSPDVHVGAPRPVPTTSFPRAPGEAVPTGIGNVIPGFHLTPPTALLEDRATRQRLPTIAAPAPPALAPPAPPTIQSGPPAPIHSLLPPLPGTVLNPALAPPNPTIMRLADAPKPRSRLHEVLHAVAHPLNAATGIPTTGQILKAAIQTRGLGGIFGPNMGMGPGMGTGWSNSGGYGGYGGWGGGWGGYYGNGTGMGGAGIGYGTGGGYNPNK